MLPKILVFLVGLSLSFAHAAAVYTQAAHYDSKAAKMVIGGVHPFPTTEQQQLNNILILLNQKQTDTALEQLNRLIPQTQALLAKDSRRAYATFADQKIALLTLLQSASEKKDAYLVAREWAMPLYFRAYAHIEKGNLRAAKADLDAALQLAPFDAQILNERGHYHILQKDWAAAEADFQKAQDMAKLLSPTVEHIALQSRALRGLGYVAVERKQWDKATAFYQQALALNPQDGIAKQELAFVERNRTQ